MFYINFVSNNLFIEGCYTTVHDVINMLSFCQDHTYTFITLLTMEYLGLTRDSTWVVRNLNNYGRLCTVALNMINLPLSVYKVFERGILL